jgi:hypothetical protein
VKRNEGQNFLAAARLSSFLAPRFDQPVCLPRPHPVAQSFDPSANYPEEQVHCCS